MTSFIFYSYKELPLKHSYDSSSQQFIKVVAGTRVGPGDIMSTGTNKAQKYKHHIPHFIVRFKPDCTDMERRTKVLLFRKKVGRAERLGDTEKVGDGYQSTEE